MFFPPPSGSAHTPIVPLFLPFGGCRVRCVFCAQDRQTGQAHKPLEQSLDFLEHTLSDRESEGRFPVDVAFYGGTFTCLPEHDRQRCMNLVRRWKARGVVRAARCSTRPDAVDLEALIRLKDRGLDRVELGVQSFDDTALCASRRGYTATQALHGCRIVREAGLELGIQLLPGMPGSTPPIFLRDVDAALDLHPACLRFYPCLVVEGTVLAAMWRSGEYMPWSETCTVQTLGTGLALAWERGVPVIRLSLAPEPDLDAAVLAGPRHPALGNMIQAEALWLRLSPVLRAQTIPEGFGIALHLPRHCQGLYAGHAGTLLPRWKALGVRRVCWLPKGEHNAEVRLAACPAPSTTSGL